MTTPLLFPDVSGFQGRVNWQAVHDSGCPAGWAKATEGTGYTNPDWESDALGMAEVAAGAGSPASTAFIPGAYMFVHQGLGPGQADYFREVAGPLDGFGIFVDVEPYPAIGSYPTYADAAGVVRRLRQLYPGKPVGGYLPPWYWGNQDTTFVDWLYASRYVTGVGSPGWLYSRAPASFWDGYGGRPVEVLQFTSAAVIPGISGQVDCNAFRGTTEQYAQMVLNPLDPPPPPPPNQWQETMMTNLPDLSETAHNDPMFVRRCQALLDPAGVPVQIDGVYGPHTAGAVRHVQSAHGLNPDGVCGPHTWSVLITGADL